MHSRMSVVLWRLAKLLIALAVAPYVANGQVASELGVRPGAPLRVYPREGPVCESFFVSATPLALRMRDTCGTSDSAVPWDGLARVDALVPRGPSAGRIVGGALIGGASTLLLIIGTGLVTNEVADCQWDQGNCPVLGVVAAAPVLIGIGTGVGAIIGYRSRPRRWITVWP
jgi:hypothetical protein